MVRVIKHTEAHYEVKEVEFGEVYRWRPERLMLECECGERPTLTNSMTACDGCATDHIAIFRGSYLPRRVDTRLTGDDEADQGQQQPPTAP